MEGVLLMNVMAFPETEQGATCPVTTVPRVKLEHATKSFSGQQVLRNLSISVRQGETLVVIGESGCGKSVTLKLMMALLHPEEGCVYWNGTELEDFSSRELKKKRLKFGFLFQGAALFDSMSVYENIAFGLRQNTNLHERSIQDIVCERLQDVGLEPSVCKKHPADLSGGMKKRVGLARALALTPEVMFYDEPTTGLDPVMSDVINELILKINAKTGMTCVVVTHDMKTVRKVADHVAMISPLKQLPQNSSQLLFEGTTDELFQAEDWRVRNFVEGIAGDRLIDLAHDS